MAWGRKKTKPMKPEELARAWRLGLRAAVAEDWPAAESWLERIVESDTSNLDAYHALARLYRRQGAVGRAIRMHQNLLLRSDLPKNDRGEALFELARDFEDGGFVDRAAASYEELLDLQPRNTEALARIIPLLADQRETARALALIKKLRRRDAEEADRLEISLLLADARSRLEEGDHASARQAIKRCLRRRKNCAPALEILGELEAEKGRSARALDAWKRAAIADAEAARRLYPKIAAGYAARKKPADFDSFLRDILKTRPEDQFARIALARALASRGEGVSAIEELARSIEVSPDAIELRTELGRHLLAAGQDAEALKAYSELLSCLERGVADSRATQLASDGSKISDTSNASNDRASDSSSSAGEEPNA